MIAPTLVARDGLKTDRRDAEKLARSYRSDDLTAVGVPDKDSEALRDLVRAREAAKQDQLRARHGYTSPFCGHRSRQLLGVFIGSFTDFSPRHPCLRHVREYV